MEARRRPGLSNFPGTPPVGSACRGSDPRPLCAIGRSRAQGPSAASHVRQSGGSRLPCSRIDRRATHGRIMGCKFAAEPRQIESSVDLPHQVIFGNRVAKTKLVEQLTLVTLQTAHHGMTSPRFASTQRNHASRPVSTDFCNKIDP